MLDVAFDDLKTICIKIDLHFVHVCSRAGELLS